MGIKGRGLAGLPLWPSSQAGGCRFSVLPGKNNFAGLREKIYEARDRPRNDGKCEIQQWLKKLKQKKSCQSLASKPCEPTALR